MRLSAAPGLGHTPPVSDRFASRSLEPDQLLMFAEDALPVFMPDAEAAREKLQDMLEKMRAAASWPWKNTTVVLYRENVWPSLLGKLGDEQEAARLRAEIHTEITRLDAAA
jgi:hypothetical protein